jgi:hypothetical protein
MQGILPNFHSGAKCDRDLLSLRCDGEPGSIFLFIGRWGLVADSQTKVPGIIRTSDPYIQTIRDFSAKLQQPRRFGHQSKMDGGTSRS